MHGRSEGARMSSLEGYTLTWLWVLPLWVAHLHVQVLYNSQQTAHAARGIRLYLTFDIFAL